MINMFDGVKTSRVPLLFLVFLISLAVFIRSTPNKILWPSLKDELAYRNYSYRGSLGDVDGVDCRGCNVVVILIDALRTDHMGYYGYVRNTTPFLDSISSNSINFINCYSPESSTVPSITSFFISEYPINHKMTSSSFRLSGDFTTMAEVFERNGYKTAAFVFNPSLKAQTNIGQGFGLYDDNPDGFVGETFAEKFETASKIHLKSIRWLKQSGGRPFFLYLHYRDTHFPYASPPPYDRLFELDDGGRLSSLIEDFTWKYVRPFDKRYKIRKYDSEIAYTDYRVKQLVDEITKISDKTLFVITADHGEAFFDHGYVGHGHSLYQELIHIPFILYSPWKNFSIIIDVPVEMIDMNPTILSMVGLDVPREYNGEDVFSGNYAKKYIYSGGSHERHVLIKENIKYYQYKTHSLKQIKELRNNLSGLPLREEMYDLTADPFEYNNIIHENPRLADEFRQKIKEIVASQSNITPEVYVVDKETRKRLKALGYLV